MIFWTVLVTFVATVTLVVLVRERDWWTLKVAALCLVIMAAILAPVVWAYS